MPPQCSPSLATLAFITLLENNRVSKPTRFLFCSLGSSPQGHCLCGSLGSEYPSSEVDRMPLPGQPSPMPAWIFFIAFITV